MYVKKLLENYSSPAAGQLLTRVAIKGGFLELPGLTIGDELKDEFYESLSPDYSKLAFYDWRELYNEISETIAGCNNNETQISRYVCSILMPFARISEYLFTSGNSNQNSADLSKFLWEYARNKYNADKEKAEIQKKAEDKFKDSNYVKVLPDGTLNYSFLDYINEEEKKIYMSKNFFDHKFLRHIISTFSHLSSAIEGALLINGAQNGLFEYQDKCGVVICKSISAKRLCEHLGWTEKIASSLLPSPISYPESIKKEPNTGRYRPTGVTEIDDILERINTRTYQPSKKELEPILKSFQFKCQEKANSNLSSKEKEVWIAKILDALVNIYLEHTVKCNYSFSYIATEFWGRLEAEFLAATEQICVRKIARELNFEDILDTPYNNKDTQWVVLNDQLWEKPYSLLYSKLWPNLGLSTHYHEKRICEACDDMSCKYRYGVKNLTALEIEYASKKYPHSDSIVLSKEAKEEMEEVHTIADEQNVRNIKPLDTGFYDSNSLNHTVITDELKKYLSAFAQEGYLDQNYHWIRIKGHTVYHAGWMAKIITSNVTDITYRKIEDIIKCTGLTDAASKCVTQAKKTKIAEIEAVCTAHGLSKKTY